MHKKRYIFTPKKKNLKSEKHVPFCSNPLYIKMNMQINKTNSNNKSIVLSFQQLVPSANLHQTSFHHHRRINMFQIQHKINPIQKSRTYQKTSKGKNVQLVKTLFEDNKTFPYSIQFHLKAAILLLIGPLKHLLLFMNASIFGSSSNLFMKPLSLSKSSKILGSKRRC